VQGVLDSPVEALGIDRVAHGSQRTSRTRAKQTTPPDSEEPGAS
jgi:hypothetical protein